MLKFKSQKKSYIPKFSIIIWIVTLVAIIVSLYYLDAINLNKLFAINPMLIANELQQSNWNIFRLISAIFLHGSWQHWVGNMLIFLIIAVPIEKKLGSFWFLLIYFASGFSANLSSVMLLHDSDFYLLGASGAVSGLLGAWLILFPRHKVSVIFPIGFYLQKAEVPLVMFGFIWLIIQLILQITSPKTFPVVWGAHIVGFIIGFLIAWLYRIISK